MDEAAALWSMIHYPTLTTMDQLKCLIFDNRSYGYNVTLRYCDDKFRLPSKTLQTTFSSSLSHFENNVNKAQNLVQYCRSHPRPENSPQHLQDDFIPLPDNIDDDNFFTFDTTGNHQQHLENSNNTCPSNLHEMLAIVTATRKSLEKQQQNLLPTFSSISHFPCRSSYTTPTRTNLMRNGTRSSQSQSSAGSQQEPCHRNLTSNTSSNQHDCRLINKFNLLQTSHTSSDSDDDESY